MRCTLMNEDSEVLAFEIDVRTGAVRDVEPLDGAARAPLGILVDWCRPEPLLERFVDGRCISIRRSDASDIFAATGACSAVDLAIRSGGFSLSDHYWYRTEGSSRTWCEGNYFDNAWDPSFGRAVLAKDYRALASASIFTPNATGDGSSRKAWVLGEDGPRLLKVAEVGGVEGELLTSRLLARLLNKGEFVPYEPVELAGETLTSSPLMLGPREELAMAWQVVSAAGGPKDGGSLYELLGPRLVEAYRSSLAALGVEGVERSLAQMAVTNILVLNRDVHPTNYGVIRDLDSGALRLAPHFDFDHCFGLSGSTDLAWAVRNPQLIMLLVASRFSEIDPTLDYSWYDPQALDGFENEIEDLLSTCDALPEGYAELVARLFVAQRTYLHRALGLDGSGDA